MPASEFNRLVTRYDFAGIIVVAAVTLPLVFTMGIRHDTTGWLVGSLIVSQVVGVIAHEFGHAIGAWATGAHVNYMRLGPRSSRRKPWVFSPFGFPIQVHGFPLCGSVQSSLYETDQYRAKRCIMVAGGPVANIVLLLVGLVLIPVFPDDVGHSVLLGWVQANAALIAISVIPMKVQIYGKKQGNDALILWDTLHYTDEKIRQIVDHAARARDMKMDADDADAMTIPELLAKHAAEPANPVTLLFLVEKLREADDPRHLDYLLKLIEMPLPKEVISEYIDSGITRQLHHGPSDRPELIDQLSLRLLALNDTISTRGTRGSVLVDLGRVDEGWTMLQEVLWKTESQFDKVYVHIFLALAEVQRGNRPVAQEHAREARKIDPQCPALPRVSDLLHTPS